MPRKFKCTHRHTHTDKDFRWKYYQTDIKYMIYGQFTEQMISERKAAHLVIV